MHGHHQDQESKVISTGIPPELYQLIYELVGDPWELKPVCEGSGGYYYQQVAEASFSKLILPESENQAESENQVSSLPHVIFFKHPERRIPIYQPITKDLLIQLQNELAPQPEDAPVGAEKKEDTEKEKSAIRPPLISALEKHGISVNALNLPEQNDQGEEEKQESLLSKNLNLLLLPANSKLNNQLIKIQVPLCDLAQLNLSGLAPYNESFIKHIFHSTKTYFYNRNFLLSLDTPHYTTLAQINTALNNNTINSKACSILYVYLITHQQVSLESFYQAYVDLENENLRLDEDRVLSAFLILLGLSATEENRAALIRLDELFDQKRDVLKSFLNFLLRATPENRTSLIQFAKVAGNLQLNKGNFESLLTSFLAATPENKEALIQLGVGANSFQQLDKNDFKSNLESFLAATPENKEALIPLAKVAGNLQLSSDNFKLLLLLRKKHKVVFKLLHSYLSNASYNVILDSNATFLLTSLLVKSPNTFSKLSLQLNLRDDISIPTRLLLMPFTITLHILSYIYDIFYTFPLLLKALRNHTSKKVSAVHLLNMAVPIITTALSFCLLPELCALSLLYSVLSFCYSIYDRNMNKYTYEKNPLLPTEINPLLFMLLIGFLAAATLFTLATGGFPELLVLSLVLSSVFAILASRLNTAGNCFSLLKHSTADFQKEAQDLTIGDMHKPEQENKSLWCSTFKSVELEVKEEKMTHDASSSGGEREINEPPGYKPW
jgi:hypothetical protein